MVAYMTLSIDRGLTHLLVQEALDYHPESGLFLWRTQRNSHSTPGKLAGCRNSLGYWEIGLNGVTRPAHRLAWVLVHGAFPQCSVDHINGDRCDNRIQNLRLADASRQAMNRGTRSDSATGIKGVRWDAKSRRWVARIGWRGERVIIGRYQSEAEAAAAYDAAAAILFGAFAKPNGGHDGTSTIDDRVLRAVGRLRQRHAHAID